MTAQPIAPHPVAAHALSPMLCSSYVQGSSYAPFDWYSRLSALPADAPPSVQSSDGHARAKASKPRRQSYDVRFKLKVVRAALARPPGQRIKPTCRDFPDIEPVQLRKWIRNLAALEVASPTKRCLSAGARREHAALDDEAEHASDASSLPTIPNSPVMESPSAPEPAQCGKAALSPPLPQQQQDHLQQQHHQLQQQQQHHQLQQQQQHHQLLQQHHHHLQQQQQQHLQQQQQQQQQYNQPQHPSDQPPPHHTPPRPSDQQPAPPPLLQQQQPHLHHHLHLHLHQPLHHSLEPPLHHPLRHSFHPHHAPSAAESAYCGGYSPHHSKVWLPMQQYLPHAEIPRAQQLYGAHQPLKQWLLLRQSGMAPPLLPREMPYPPVQRPVPVRTAPPPTAAPASPSLSPFSSAAPPAPAASTGDRLGQKEQLAALELIHMASAE